MIGFKTYVVKKYRYEDSPYGDFARDVEADKNFPKNVKDGYEIKDYLLSMSACDAAIEVFEELWNKYKGYSLK